MRLRLQPDPEIRRASSLLESSPLIGAMILACAVLGLVAMSLHLRSPDGIIADYTVFHLVAQMVQDGTIADAYTVKGIMARLLEAVGGTQTMSWNYPPVFDMLLAPLAWLGPRSLGYVIFAGLGFAAYVALIRRFAGPFTPAVLIAVTPVSYVTLMMGQNGFLTAVLMGLWALWALQGRDRAGLPLGVMVIKPHLALGIAVLVLARARWRMFLMAFAVALALCLASLLLLGADVWRAFFAGAKEVQQNLQAGFFPYYQMISVYAMLMSLGLPSGTAMLVQAGVALGASAAIVTLARRGRPLRQVIGFTLVATLAFSPYGYRYDVPVAGIALALVIGALMQVTRIRDRLLGLAFFWLWTGWAFLAAASVDLGLFARLPALGDLPPLSFAALGHLGTLAWLWRMLAREAAPAAAGAALAGEPA